MTATHHAEAADSIFAHMDFLAQQRSQVAAAAQNTTSRRQKRKLHRRLREIDRKDDETQAEYEAWAGTEDVDWLCDFDFNMEGSAP